MKPAPPVTRIRARAPRRGASVTGPSADRTLDRPGEPTGVVVIASELGRPEQRGDGAGVRPVAVVDAAEQAVVGDVVVQDVRDLELATSRGRERVDDREGVRAEKVHPDRDQVAL